MPSLTVDEQLVDLRVRIATYAAVQEERDKTVFNTLAAMQGQISELDRRLNNMTVMTNGKFERWMIAITGASVTVAGTVTGLLLWGKH